MPPPKPIEIPGCTFNYDSATNKLVVSPLNPNERVELAVPSGTGSLAFTIDGKPALVFDHAGTRALRLKNPQGQSVVTFRFENGDQCDLELGGDEMTLMRLILSATRIDVASKTNFDFTTKDPAGRFAINVGGTPYVFKQDGLFANDQPMVSKAYVDAAIAALQAQIDSKCTDPVSGSLEALGWVNSTKLPFGSPNHREMISVLGTIRAFVADSRAVFYDDTGRTSQVALEGISAVVHSFQLIAVNTLVVIAGREALEYALIGVDSPLPLTAKLMSRQTVLTDNAQTAFSIRLTSGAVVVAAAENLPNGAFSLAYRTPSGTWMNQGHVELGNGTPSAHQHALAEHPVTGRVWIFDVGDGGQAVTASLWREYASGLVMETMTPRYISAIPIHNGVPRDGRKSSYGELPELCAIPDKEKGVILLAYQGWFGLTFQPHIVLVSCDTPTESSSLLIFESSDEDCGDKQVASITISRTATHIVLAWDESIETTQHPRRFVRVIANDGNARPPYELFTVSDSTLGGVRSFGRPDAFDLYSGQFDLLPTPHPNFRLIQTPADSPLFA